MMNYKLKIATMKNVLILACVLAVTGAQATERDKILINKEYPISKNRFLLEVENIFGSVEIEESAGNTIQLQLQIDISARNTELLERAKSELSIREQEFENELILSMKAPFIEEYREGGRIVGRGIHHGPRYDFNYEWKLKVPKGVDVTASTVNDGDVLISGAFGSISASNVNGDVFIEKASEVEEARTVNGQVEVYFADKPTIEGSYSTINGDITLYMNNPRLTLSAKTMHGEMYSAFDFEQLPARLVTNKSQRSRATEYKIEEKVLAKIGNEEGPELSFSTLNGNIYLKKI